VAFLLRLPLRQPSQQLEHFMATLSDIFPNGEPENILFKHPDLVENLAEKHRSEKKVAEKHDAPPDRFPRFVPSGDKHYVIHKDRLARNGLQSPDEITFVVAYHCGANPWGLPVCLLRSLDELPERYQKKE
jgi:hypothetical protein